MAARSVGKGLIILDRDGVINRDSRDYVKTAAEWLPLPGSIEAIALLSKAGYTIAVATNQSGLARGMFDRNALRAMHRKLRRLVAAEGGQVDRVVACPHGPGDNCACRKPRPGLLKRLQAYYGVSLAGVPYIGDSMKDVEAARAAGATPMLVRTGNGDNTVKALRGDDANIDVFDDLLAAAHSLLAR